MRFRLRPVVFLLLCAAAPTSWAEDDGLKLQLGRALSGPASGNEDAPVFLSADKVEGQQDGTIIASGAVELRKNDQLVSADRLVYVPSTQEVTAEGSVLIDLGGSVINSPSLSLNLDTNIGQIPQPVFRFADTNGRGAATALDMSSRQNFSLRDASFTTCPIDQDDWMLKMQSLEIDRGTQLGVARNATLEFMGVPILYSPWMDFPLDGHRKTGFLAPVFGNTVQGGLELMLPFYWNISPGMDATIAPRIMTRRGIQLNSEFRYLEPNYRGEMHFDVLPDDRLTGNTRSRMSLNHVQDFGGGFMGAVNYNHVSDDAYFRDLSDAITTTSQTNLIREGVLSYDGGWWQAAAKVQSFQTLQDPLLPLVIPYDSLPQLSFLAERSIAGADVEVEAEYTDFHHPTLVNGRRMMLYPTVSYPWIAEPAFHLTSKVGVHGTYYALGSNNVSNLPDASRTLPIFSLDGGMTFERDANFGGMDFVQTLEPRVFYTYIPYRDQSNLPNFDSSLADFSFAQIFTENRYFGSDRIGDANQVTLAMTSRLIDPDTGAPKLSVAVGQRFSMQVPRVSLPGDPPPASNRSDILLGITGQVTRDWSVDSLLQYSPTEARGERFNIAASYQPEIGKVLNLGYRFTRDSIKQVDVSAQWPLSQRWHGVGRWNYSLQDGKILEAMAGLEYNQDCWTVRLVAQRFVTGTGRTSTGVFLQLELSDLISIGANPLSLLHQDVPGYAKMNSLPASELRNPR
ncbi:MAG: LPS-assembly protein LptD [Gallionellaceae bacterium]|jgi:LPS-assembly protein|nr:LPS-assembly protein LptD [Gallionellaceae bacterium]